MATMKAVRIHSFGGPKVLQIDEIDIPQPADDEVLIRVHAASVNPVDYKIRAGGYPPVTAQQLPKILGRDIAGTIERCGSAITRWREGDPVYAMLDGGGAGGYAEFVCLKGELCAPKPAHLNFAEAAAVPLAALTAWQGEFDHGHLMAGQHELIHGGAGGVGHFAIQFAKARGATVATTCSREDFEFVRSHGADEAIDYRTDRFEDRLHDIDLVFDLIGGETQERSWEVLKDGGTLISTLTPPSEQRAREHHAHAESYVARPNAIELTEIGRLIDEDRVHPHLHEVYPLEEAAEAQRALESGHVRGKIVLKLVA